MRNFISRREAFVWLGGLIAAGCGSSEAEPAVTSAAPPSPTATPRPDASSGVTPTVDAGAPVDAADAELPLPSTPEELLAGIDSIVVLMMENRSFDHFLGTLKTDATYASSSTVDGLTGTESNPAPDGSTVSVFKLANFTPEDPPHSWAQSHDQFNGGANDGFVKAHAGASQSEVMGFHDRAQLPFYYWLADHFTVCDQWFSSVMGPTWPNRFYLHACTSGGKKTNAPFFTNPPPTIWKRLAASGKTFKNYNAGVAAWYTGAFIGDLVNMNPVRGISEFYSDAANGTLPNFAIIDPDFLVNDDHPSHDIKKGQSFAASVYRAIAESPQWPRTLLVIIYDEHGGFYDHVAPPKTTDPLPEFEQLGFRVPAFVIGGMVRKGHVEHTAFEHTSVAATVKTRFGIQSLGARMDVAASLASCIDPALARKPAPAPPMNFPMPLLRRNPSLDSWVGETSQPELQAMIDSGTIPSVYLDKRPHTQRIEDWLLPAERLGAVRVQRI